MLAKIRIVNDLQQRFLRDEMLFESLGELRDQIAYTVPRFLLLQCAFEGEQKFEYLPCSPLNTVWVRFQRLGGHFQFQ